jgi:UPF0176 protein
VVDFLQWIYFSISCTLSFSMNKEYFVLAYYQFVSLDDPHAEVKKHKDFLEKKECTGRIYLSEEGISGQMSGSLADTEAYMLWLKEDSRFSSIAFKIHSASEHIFPRMTIKYRPQLVALDQKIDVAERGEHVSAAQWKEMLASGEYLVLDVRNRYEWEIGHFEGAVLPPLNTFREFPAYAEELKGQVDPSTTKVMMYCTGGIRCELYSALLKKKGFEKVYQLEGGVINYGLKEGSKHWNGKLFVFDDRLAISIDGKESEPISRCVHCYGSCDTYYNCANMDCNELFICCLSCLEGYQGCCSYPCTEAPRVRPFDPNRGNKPFRRAHLQQFSGS